MSRLLIDLFFVSMAATLSCAGYLLLRVFSSDRSRASMQRLLEVSKPNDPSGSLLAAPQPLPPLLARQVHWLHVHLRMQATELARQRLAHAGYRSLLACETYQVSRAFGPILGMFAALLLPGHYLPGAIILGSLAYLVPDLALRYRTYVYRKKIHESLPDVIDLLVICVDAGLGVDQGLLRVSQELGLRHPEVTAELLQVSREQRAGKPRIEAWSDFGVRAGSSDLQSFTSMLTQTERFGTPIARALGTFGDTMRQKRKHQVEEQAAKTTVKIIFPLVLCIFPSIFLVILGPAVLTLMRGIFTVAR